MLVLDEVTRQRLIATCDEQLEVLGALKDGLESMIETAHREAGAELTLAGELVPGVRILVDGAVQTVVSVSRSSRRDMPEVAVRTNVSVLLVPAGRVVEVVA